MLKLAGARVLDERDLAGIRSLIDLDPVAACMVVARIEAVGVNPVRLGGELWGHGHRLDGLCYSGGNLIPLCGGRSAIRAFADKALRRGRSCSSMVGPSELVMALWTHLLPDWGPAREVRTSQPLLGLSRAPCVPADPLVRPVRPDEIDRYLPAAIAMFTEEVGVDPRNDGGADGYRARVAELVGGGRAFARFEGDRVVFKAEIGSMSRSVGQIQGVWVHPERRGQGLGTAGTAAVADRLVRGLGRTASLYVNDFNGPARTVYDKLGFEQRGSFSTVLF